MMSKTSEPNIDVIFLESKFMWKISLCGKVTRISTMEHLFINSAFIMRMHTAPCSIAHFSSYKIGQTVYINPKALRTEKTSSFGYFQ